MKTCTQCGETKPLSAFGLTKTGNTKSLCLDCFRKRNKEYKAAAKKDCRRYAPNPWFQLVGPLFHPWTRPMRFSMCGRVFGHPTGVTYADN